MHKAVYINHQKHVLGIVVTTSPTWSLYNMVVFPAPSKPKMRILISLVPNRPEKRLEKNPPVKTTELYEIIEQIRTENGELMPF